MEQLMWLLELTLGGGDEEEEAQAQAQQDQQASGSGAAGSAGAGLPPGDTPGAGGSEEPSFPMLRRGPRPAHDPAALEPSPAAVAPPLLQQAADSGRVPRPTSADAAAGEEADQEEVHVALEALLPGRAGGG